MPLFLTYFCALQYYVVSLQFTLYEQVWNANLLSLYKIFPFLYNFTFHAHFSYQMVSRTNFRRCMAEGWDGVVPICEGKNWNEGPNLQTVGDVTLWLFLHIIHPLKYIKKNTVLLTYKKVNIFIIYLKLIYSKDFLLNLFFLLAQQCPVIHVNNNVQVIGDPEEATYGNVIRFSCKSSSEVLEGSSEIYCNEYGDWSADPPICKGTVGWK